MGTNAIVAAGRDSPLTTNLSIEGMNCGNCVRHVTEALQAVPGVSSAAVTLETTRAKVRWSNETDPNPNALLVALKQAGYDGSLLAEPQHSAHEHEHAKVRGWQSNLWIAGVGTALLMAGEWIFGLSMTPWFRWTAFGIASVVQFTAGASFYRGAWRQLKSRSSNMDTLVALGSTTAYAYSVWVLWSGKHEHLYFMEAAAIISLISIGHWVEARVSAKASTSLRRLLDLAPAKARRLMPDGTEREIGVAELQLGDVISLRPGDRVPTDGRIVQGQAAMDESMLTGESLPVEKTVEGDVFGGTLNTNGVLQVRVTTLGEETALARIIAAVQRAQTSRANIQRLGDQVSSVFVPIVIAIALLTGIWWGVFPDQARAIHQTLSSFLWEVHSLPVGVAAAFVFAAAVLIVACPCAMGLATPAAIMAGSNVAAERGILIRDAIALEKAGAINVVMFDKTGTLTIGKPTVLAHEILGSEANALAIAVGLARQSTHPLSQAVAALAIAPVEVGQVREIRGSGLQGQVESKPVRLGSLHWLQNEGIGTGRGEKFSGDWFGKGATILGLSINSDLCAVIALQDALKPGAPEVIRRLQRLGHEIHLITGDNAATASNIARQIGIADSCVHAQVRPEAKAALIREQQERGAKVAFVGDGINDAPALEQADLGIAVSRASDVARESADIILLKSEIEAVSESLGLARATLRTIKQNLFWAFFYNAAGIPLAALGFMSPVLCAAAMGFSDLIVIGNALRLRLWKPAK